MPAAMPIRVLHIASGDLWAGAEAQVLTLLSALNERADVEVAAAILNPGELAQRLQHAGVQCRVFDEGQLPAWRIALALRRYMAEFGADVVHTHRQKENILGALMAASLHIPSVRTTHGADEHAVSWRQAPKWMARQVDALVATRVQSRVVAVSHALGAQLTSSLPGAHIEVIDNTVDLGDIERRSAGHGLRPTAPPWRVGIVGRLVPVKRVDIFLAAASELERRRPSQFEFVVIGDGPLLADLKAQAAATPAEVRFTGFVSNPLPEIAAMNVLAITSDHEGLPTVALEALALRLPVVTRAVGGLPALAAAGGDCVLVGDAPVERLPAMIADAIEASVMAPRPSEPLPRQFLAPEGAARHLQLYLGLQGGRR
jgi:glycosyltransferase involved in cell wall biosynthesis